MKTLLTVTAFFEAGAGLLFAVSPPLTAWLLFGVPIDLDWFVVSTRILAAIVLVLATLAWRARSSGSNAFVRAIVGLLLGYNLLAAGGLAYLSVRSGLGGPLLWPAVMTHTGFGAWCLRSLLQRKRDPSPTTTGVV